MSQKPTVGSIVHYTPQAYVVAQSKDGKLAECDWYAANGLELVQADAYRI